MRYKDELRIAGVTALFCCAILRAVGDTKRPLFFLVICGMTNAVLNLVLVIVFHMGVAGVAIGTIVSQLISSILVLRCLYRRQQL